MWPCIRKCMREQLKGFAWWVFAILVAAVASLVVGAAGITIIAATAAIAIGVAGATIMIYCYRSCN